FASMGFAQNPSRVFNSIEDKNNYYEIKVNDGSYRIQYYSDEIVETTFIPSGESYVPNSHAVILKGNSYNTLLIEEENFAYLENKGIKVTIQKQPFQISY